MNLKSHSPVLIRLPQCFMIQYAEPARSGSTLTGCSWPLASPLPLHIDPGRPDITTFSMKTHFFHFSSYWFSSGSPGSVPAIHSTSVCSAEIRVSRHSDGAVFEAQRSPFCVCRSIHNPVTWNSNKSCELLVHFYRWWNKSKKDKKLVIAS